jgi:hypothetical protein
MRRAARGKCTAEPIPTVISLSRSTSTPMAEVDGSVWQCSTSLYSRILILLYARRPVALMKLTF